MTEEINNLQGANNMNMEITFMSQLWTIRAAKPKELVDCLGQCDPGTNTIIIDPDLPASVMLQTLGHELVHLIEQTMNLHLTEQQVDCIASGAIHLLKTNPELLQLYSQSENTEDDF